MRPAFVPFIRPRILSAEALPPRSAVWEELWDAFSISWPRPTPFRKGNVLWLSDGFHRCHAQKDIVERLVENLPLRQGDAVDAAAAVEAELESVLRGIRLARRARRPMAHADFLPPG